MTIVAAVSIDYIGGIKNPHTYWLHLHTWFCHPERRICREGQDKQRMNKLGSVLHSRIPTTATKPNLSSRATIPAAPRPEWCAEGPAVLLPNHVCSLRAKGEGSSATL